MTQSATEFYDDYTRFNTNNLAYLIEAFRDAHGRFNSLLERDVTISEFLDTCARNRIVLHADYKPL